LTVLVPTRERAETLAYTLRTTIDQKSTNFEVLVSDNFSQDGTRGAVEAINDPRIRYINTGQRLSMSDNWDFALPYCEGEYITVIGDDDAIMPGAIDRIEPLFAAGRERIITWPVPIYAWPMDGKPPAVTHLPANAKQTYVNVRKLARFAVRMGGWRHHVLPYIYHSAFHRSIPEGIKARAGRVFHTTQPDIFSGFAGAAFTETGLNVGFPVSVAGHSKKSNGGAMTGGTSEQGKEMLRQHYKEYGEYKVHPSLDPEIPARVNTLPDSMLVAKDLFPETYGDVPFGYSEMWAYMYRLRKAYRWEIGSPLDVLRKRDEFRKYHPFSVPKFLGFLAFMMAIEQTRSLRRKREDLGRFAGITPPNIADFVKTLARMQATEGETR